MKVFNSKCYRVGEINTWWFAVHNPEKWLDKETEISFVLHNESNSRQLGVVHIRLDETGWHHRIMNSTRYPRKKRDTVLVHIKNRVSFGYHIYFGRKSEGYYPIVLERN